MVIQDLFISYHDSDCDSVRTVRQQLLARGIATFLDRENLVAGLPWPQALEEALQSVSAVAVFIGHGGLGLWQKREMGFALERQVQEERENRSFPVIPILLPGADPTPGFLFLNTWIDLRQDLTDSQALDAIVQAVRGAISFQSVEATIPLCPYRGLRAFYEEHAAFFVGREAVAERLMEQTLSQNLVAVVGPSGSGKSSLVQAGLLPLLRRQRPPAATWDAVTFTPGDRPFHHLGMGLIPMLETGLSEIRQLKEAKELGDLLVSNAVLLKDAISRTLAKSQGTDRLLMIVDQFEELFTVAAESYRRPFVDSLLGALEAAPVTVVIVLRSDFYGNAIGLSRNLSDALERNVVNVGPMNEDELQRAVVEPARCVKLTFEPGLAERILNDVGAEPGSLPLLEFALTELWSRRQERILTHEAYEHIGKVRGAIAHRAESVFKCFTLQQQEIARRVFTRLVCVARPEERGDATRRRVNLMELGNDARPVVKALTDARLLVAGRPMAVREKTVKIIGHEAGPRETVEMAHEALIHGWKRLQEWVVEDREFLQWRERLRGALTEWVHTERDEGTLLRGVRLGEAERWLAERRGDMNESERAFIDESSRLAQKQSEETKLFKEYAQLVGNIAHDLKNLLVPVVSGASLLEEELKELFRSLPNTEASNAKASEKLCMEVIDMIGQSTRRINGLIMEIGDYAKGTVTRPVFSSCGIGEIISAVMRTLHISAEQKSISLRSEGLETLPVIKADERRLFNAFYALVDNAIRDIPPGGSITVRGQVDLQAKAVNLSVEDTGRDTPPQSAENLFTGFAISRKPGGTGLGMKVVKDVVDAHSGSITVKSREGVDTVFHISLPISGPALTTEANNR